MVGTPSSHPSLRSVAWSVCVSLAFWVCLLVSASLFAAVALAPKCLQWQRLSDQFAANQHYLVAVERQTLQLRQVVAALNDDPAFAEELARVEFDAFRPDEETIPVADGLRLDRRAFAVPAPRTSISAPAWQPLLVLLATDRPVRTALLLAAAVLVIASFTWLDDGSDAGKPSAELARPPSWWQRLRARYRPQ